MPASSFLKKKKSSLENLKIEKKSPIMNQADVIKNSITPITPTQTPSVSIQMPKIDVSKVDTPSDSSFDFKSLIPIIVGIVVLFFLNK